MVLATRLLYLKLSDAKQTSILFDHQNIIKISVGIATRLWAGRSGFDSWRGARNCSLRHRVQTGSEAHSASYTTRTGGSFPGGEVAGV
jgi:hypothetical protein